MRRPRDLDLMHSVTVYERVGIDVGEFVRLRIASQTLRSQDDFQMTLFPTE
jgi:hypothetical protein